MFTQLPTGRLRVPSMQCWERSADRRRPSRLLTAVLAVVGAGPGVAAAGGGINGGGGGSINIELVPDAPGPYTGGQAVTVDVVFNNLEPFSLPVYLVRLDFADTDPAIGLPADFDWLLEPVTAGDPTMPVPQWQITAGPQNVIPPFGSLTVGRVTVTAPAERGCYELDVMNADEPDRTRGAQFEWLEPVRALVIWRAYTGELVGGTLTMEVGPLEELCNGRDDDCDGLIDEGFETEIIIPGSGETIILSPGDPCFGGEGECEAPGRIVCTEDGLGVECESHSPPPGVEGPVDDPSCFNFKDDDCDGLTDHEDPDCTGPERCDGFDNDNDGEIDEDYPELGDVCVVGDGLCEKEGILICTEDGSGTECNAAPYPPHAEGPPGWPRCGDGLDNDCDGLIDLEDPDCQEPESCDGKDNDGDGEIDEDFSDLGDPCSVGQGPCRRDGSMVCTADGSGTTCDASAGRPSPEGPAGCDCADGLDNDCDGLIDRDDPDCGSADLGVTCALPYTCRPEGDDCRSWHTVDYEVLNPVGDVQVLAELVALDADGDPLVSIPVELGDSVRLASRVDAVDFEASTTEVDVDLALFALWDDCETGPDNGPIPAGCEALDSDCDDDIDLADHAAFQQKFGQTLRFHTLSAPVVFLHVAVDNGFNHADAVCSNMPYLKVITPADEVLGSGDSLRVLTAIPNVDPASLSVGLNGVDLLAGLGLDPATDFPGGPYGGTVAIHDCTVEVCDLIVDSAPSDTLSSNTLSMTLRDLCCGGGTVVVRGVKREGSYPDDPAPACLVDDLRDTGLASVFEFTIFTPTDGLITPGGDTQVQGEICHNKELVCPFPTTCGPFVKLNGTWLPLTGPDIMPPLCAECPPTLIYSFDHTLPTRSFDESVLPGTFHPGGERLIAEAWDVLGNVALSDPVVFAVGPVRPPPSAFRGDTEVPNAVTLTMTGGGLTTAFDSMMSSKVSDGLLNVLQDWLAKFDNFKQDIPMPIGLPDWTIHMTPYPETAALGPQDPVTTVDLADGQMTVTTVLPDFEGQALLEGQYRIKACGPFGNICVCVARFTLDALIKIKIQGAEVSFVITEADILNNNAVEPQFTVPEDAVDAEVLAGGLEIDCALGFVFDLINVLAEVVNTAFKILTFGQWDPDLGLGLPLEDYIEDVNFQDALDLLDGDPLNFDFVQLDDAVFPAFNVEMTSEMAEVQITPQGLAIAYNGTFAPTPGSLDPEAAMIPGTPLTDGPLALPVIPGADQVTFGLADDFFNQLLYGLTITGGFRSSFDEVRLLNDLLPPDCAALATPQERGQCAALRGEDCSQFDGIDEAAELVCDAATDTAHLLNIDATTPMILHGRIGLAPKVVIDDDPATDGVLEAVLRIGQISVSMLADRDGDGEFDVDMLASVPECDDAVPATETTCLFWETCYDVDFFLDLDLTTDPDGVPVLTPTVVDSSIQTAVMCGGGGGVMLPDDDWIDELAQAIVLTTLTDEVTNNTPPFEMDGLDFGDLIELTAPRAIAVETDGDPTIDEYLGLTSDVQAP